MARDEKDMDRNEFYAAAMQPGFPNKMRFAVSIPEESRTPERTFSYEAIDGLTEQIRSFVMARIFGASREGVMPHEMTIDLDVGFEGTTKQDLADGDRPFWIGEDRGPTAFDGTYRANALRSGEGE